MSGAAVAKQAAPTAATAQPSLVNGHSDPEHDDTSCDSCAERSGVIQRCAGQGDPGRAHGVGEVLRTPGQPLDAAIRTDMEHRFGTDFSQVRIHTEARASDSARSLGAAAYTYGNDVVFRRQAYTSRTPAGLALIAHELAHVSQQRRGGGEPDGASERAAGRAADLALRGMGDPLVTAGATARGVASQSEAELARRRAQLEAELPKGVVYALDPGRLEREYRAALTEARKTGDWRQAAETLNGFDHVDIQTRLAELSDAEVGYLHAGALGNQKVGADAQVARLTGPGVPRASTIPQDKPATAPERGPGERPSQLTDDDVRAMSWLDRLLKAYELARIGEAATREIAGLISAKALVTALVTFAGTYLALQLTPVGWAANIGIAITAAFVGPVLFRAIKDLVMFASAAKATTVAELEEAGRHLADALGGVSIQVILALVLHRTANTIKGSTPLNGPPPTGFADAVATNGMIFRAPVPVGVAASPATITPIIAAQLGVKAVPAATQMMMQAGGSGGGGAGGPQAAAPSSGGGSGGSGAQKVTKVPEGSRSPSPREAERAVIEEYRKHRPESAETLERFALHEPIEKGPANSLERIAGVVESRFKELNQRDGGSRTIDRSILQEKAEVFSAKDPVLKNEWFDLQLLEQALLGRVRRGSAGYQKIPLEWRRSLERYGADSDFGRSVLKGMVEFREGKVGRKKPDIVEFVLDRGRAIVSDPTLQNNPFHRFKTKFYARVIERMTGLPTEGHEVNARKPEISEQVTP